MADGKNAGESDIRERLTATRVGRARMHEAAEGSRSAISGLDVRADAAAERLTEAPAQTRTGSKKLAEAHRLGQEMEQELRALCAGVIDRLTAIGLEVVRASEFRGFRERSLAVIGKIIPGATDQAQRLRIARLEHATTEDAVLEIRAFVTQTIAELGDIEAEYGTNLAAYKGTLTRVLAKLTEATPRHIAAQRLREDLDGRAKSLELELKAGTLGQQERPAKEADYEALQRQLEAARLDEMEHLTIVNEAQRAIPELQKNAEAAARSIESIHGMRRNLLEKTENLSTVLEHAVTAVRARAKLERYQAVDPAFNKTIELVTGHNIAVAGAAMEVAAERIKHAAIDPQKSKELLDQLLGHVADFLKEFDEIEAEARRGPRAASPNGDAA